MEGHTTGDEQTLEDIDSWQKKDFYQRLGVARNATAEEIKKAFRRLSLRYHPDTVEHSGNKILINNYQKVSELISEANVTLGDFDKKLKYDAGGSFTVTKETSAQTMEDVKNKVRQLIQKPDFSTMSFYLFVSKLKMEGFKEVEMVINMPEVQALARHRCLTEARSAAIFYDYEMGNWVSSGFNRESIEKDPEFKKIILDEAIKRIEFTSKDVKLGKFLADWEKVVPGSKNEVLSSPEFLSSLIAAAFDKVKKGPDEYKQFTEKFSEIGIEKSFFDGKVLSSSEIQKFLIDGALAIALSWGDPRHYEANIEKWVDAGVDKTLFEDQHTFVLNEIKRLIDKEKMNEEFSYHSSSAEDWKKIGFPVGEPLSKSLETDKEKFDRIFVLTDRLHNVARQFEVAQSLQSLDQVFKAWYKYQSVFKEFEYIDLPETLGSFLHKEKERAMENMALYGLLRDPKIMKLFEALQQLIKTDLELLPELDTYFINRHVEFQYSKDQSKLTYGQFVEDRLVEKIKSKIDDIVGGLSTIQEVFKRASV